MPTREAAVATLGIAEDADKGAATKAYRIGTWAPFEIMPS